MAPHSSALAWKIPWTEEPGRLQSMGSHRVGRDWATSVSLFTCMHWRRKWQPTPVLLPGKSHGRRSLVGCSPWGREESDTTEQLRFNFSLACIGEGNGNPLQCSCIENPRDREAWWPAIYGVTQSRPQLKRLSCSSSMLKSTNLTWTNHDIEIWLKPHLCVIPKSIVFLTPRWLYMKDSCLPQYASYSSTNVETPVLVITLIIGENTVRSESIF